MLGDTIIPGWPARMAPGSADQGRLRLTTTVMSSTLRPLDASSIMRRQREADQRRGDRRIDVHHGGRGVERFAVVELDAVAEVHRPLGEVLVRFPALGQVGERARCSRRTSPCGSTTEAMTNEPASANVLVWGVQPSVSALTPTTRLPPYSGSPSVDRVATVVPAVRFGRLALRRCRRRRRRRRSPPGPTHPPATTTFRIRCIRLMSIPRFPPGAPCPAVSRRLPATRRSHRHERRRHERQRGFSDSRPDRPAGPWRVADGVPPTGGDPAGRARPTGSSGTRSRRYCRWVCSTACWAASRVRADLGPQPAQLVLELEHPLHPRQVEALVGQLLDAPELLDVGVAVPAAPAARAGRVDQALALVDAQRLGMEAGELGRHRDDVHGEGGITGHGSYPQVRREATRWRARPAPRWPCAPPCSGGSAPPPRR